MCGSEAWGRDVSPTVSPQDGDVIWGRDGAVPCDAEWEEEETFSSHELEAHASRGRVHEPKHAHMHGRDDAMASEEHQKFTAASARGRDLGPGPQWSLNASSAREHILQTTHSTYINTSSSSSSTLHRLLAKSALLLQGV
jgi:hypothetical protein